MPAREPEVTDLGRLPDCVWVPKSLAPALETHYIEGVEKHSRRDPHQCCRIAARPAPLRHGRGHDGGAMLMAGRGAARTAGSGTGCHQSLREPKVGKDPTNSHSLMSRIGAAYQGRQCDTEPYPGSRQDLQCPVYSVMALMTRAEGKF